MVASQDRLLGYSLDSEFYQIDDFVSYVRDGLNKLTLADVNRVITENLQTDNIHYVFITGDGEDMKQRLVNETVSPIKYNSDKPQALLAEDKLIEQCFGSSIVIFSCAGYRVRCTLSSILAH